MVFYETQLTVTYCMGQTYTLHIAQISNTVVKFKLVVFLSHSFNCCLLISKCTQSMLFSSSKQKSALLHNLQMHRSKLRCNAIKRLIKGLVYKFDSF